MRVIRTADAVWEAEIRNAHRIFDEKLLKADIIKGERDERGEGGGKA
jgi:hypothetical protein